MELRIIQRGAPDRFVELRGDEVVIGRGADCDVVVSDRHVSNRHVRLLAGVVVVDLDSTNGTFVDGERVRGATLIPGGTFQLGGEAHDVRIEVVREATDDVEATVDSSSWRAARVARAAADPEAASGGRADPDGDLAARVARLEDALRARDSGAHAEEHTHSELSERVAQLEARLESSASRRSVKRRIGELEAGGAKLESALRDLTAAPASAAPGHRTSELFVRLQGEINHLKGEIERLRNR